MKELLEHLVEITGHRDHTLLDASVLSALQELVGAAEVRTVEIFRFRSDMFVRQRIVLKSGTLSSDDEYSGSSPGGEPIENFPALMSCLDDRKDCVKEITPEGFHVLWYPVWIKDKIGTCITLSSPTPYTGSALSLIEGVLSVYRNYQSLLDYSERDSLTGLLNRKTFDENFSKMVNSAPVVDTPPHLVQDERREPEPLKEQWLAVVDIDHFKRVNDEFGHLYGDEVLILVANLLRSSFRAQDRIFRFGGEEFVILLKSTTLKEAHSIFDRFRRSIEAHVFPQVGQVTVSLGFCNIANAMPVVILGHADQALYYAKENGRNRVCHYEDLVQNGLLQAEVSNEDVEFF